MPRVAVIIPCYNDGATLEETVASIEYQEEHELVVVNDGSDDPGTLEVLERLRERGVRVASQANGGLSSARMLGAASTTAPYIQPIDADDRLEPGALAALADALDADSGLGVVWGAQRNFGEVSLVQDRAADLDPWAITYVNRLAPGLIRREALRQTDGWVLKVGYEDWDLWMSLAERGWRGRQIDRVTISYRTSSSRMLSDARSHHADLYGQLERRHAALFAARRRNRSKSGAPRRLRALFPILDALPMSQLTRHRLQLAASEPGHAVRAKLARRRGR